MNEYGTVEQDYEKADARHERRSPLTAAVRGKLEELRAGATCQECHWQRAMRVQRGRLLCVVCGDVEYNVRSVEAIAARLHRRTVGTSSGRDR